MEAVPCATQGIDTMKQRISATIVAFALTSLGTASAHPGQDVYQMDDGLLVIEFESAQVVSDWSLEQAIPGYTGGGFLRWNGANLFGTPGVGTFGFDFEVPTSGTYDFRIRNHHDHPDSTEENDVWVRINGGEWVKCFSPVNNQWTWHTYFEFHDGTKPPASYDLSAGKHRIEFSGRSHNFRIDRFHLFTPGHPGGTDPGEPESDKSSQEFPPVAIAKVSPTGVPKGAGGVVILDGSDSYDPDGDPIAFNWKVRGGKFVDGTDSSSPVARVQVLGTGFAQPVSLTVREVDNPINRDSDYAVINVDGSDATVSGDLVVWHTTELAFEGPNLTENTQSPNPFLDYRMILTLRGPSNQVYTIHGFYDGDGKGGSAGNVWKARFTPDESGLWKWNASYRKGQNVAIQTSPTAGTGLRFDGATGSFAVLRKPKNAPGFRKHGRLEYVDEHYMRFRDGKYFLKGGTDSPENFLGYAGFDNVQDNGNIGIIHHYAPHVQDWQPGDPYFVSATSGVDSKGIIGALNYLGDVGVNSIYFLPMNLGGDGQETCPFIGYTSSDHHKTHYDVSRLHQWAQVLDHAQDKGVMLHFVLAETEYGNETWLDSGNFGVQRKLFFRELVARFGHALALKWNLSEENDFSIQQLEQMAAYINYLDPYNHPVAVHTHPNNTGDYPYLLGNANFTSTSIQYSTYKANDFVEEWRQKSAAAGRKWIIDLDENGTAGEGLTDQNADKMRKEVLYDTFFSGGQVEWYAGYHSLPLGGDVRIENFRTREEMWNYTRYAREFLEKLPFWRMSPADELLSNESSDWGGGQVFAEVGKAYAIYLPNAKYGGTLNLSNAPGDYVLRWYNPRTGEFEGDPNLIQGGSNLNLGAAPSSPSEDWVVMVKARR